MLFSCHPGLGADVDLIYEKTQARNRQYPKRNDDLMLTNAMKSSFGVLVSTCHALLIDVTGLLLVTEIKTKIIKNIFIT